jgi:hypothetical protein
MLLPVAEHFNGVVVNEMEEAMIWCRNHIIHAVADNSSDEIA